MKRNKLSSEHLNFEPSPVSKQQITSAAVKIFAQRGPQGTKISMITAEAGVSHGLFYHYFKTKEELFTSLVREAVETSNTEIDSLLYDYVL